MKSERECFVRKVHFLKLTNFHQVKTSVCHLRGHQLGAFSIIHYGLGLDCIDTNSENIANKINVLKDLILSLLNNRMMNISR